MLQYKFLRKIKYGYRKNKSDIPVKVTQIINHKITPVPNYLYKSEKLNI